MLEVARAPKYSSEQLLEKVKALLGARVVASKIYRNDVVIEVSLDQLFGAMQKLKQDAELDMAMLVDVTSVHWPQDEKEIELVYHMRSLSKNLFLVVKSRVAADESAPSMTPLWRSANWLEREVYDLMGVKFAGHPDLRRILMPEAYPWHPLRKEFPLEGPDFPIDAYETDAHHKVKPDDFWGESGAR